MTGVALVYVRQSRNRPYERTVSPETQEAACRTLPAVRRAATVDVYCDLDESGGNRARKGYLAVLDRIKTDRTVSVVAFYDSSRIARDNLMNAEFYALLERRPDVAVELVEGRFDRSPSGELSWTVMGAAAAAQRKETGRKVSASKRYAASHGQMVGAVPAGYRWEGSGRERRLVPDDEVAPIVRRVFAEYATGRHSTKDLARRLNAEGVVLPSFKTGAWRQDTVAGILANPCYIAKTYVNRTKQEGELLDASWPPLIDARTWDQVQRIRAQHRGWTGGRKPLSEQREWTFQGLLRCARCGRRMHCHAMKQIRYYYCRSNDAEEPCRRLLREDGLIPWAEQLLAVLDAYRPDDLRDQVAERQRQAQRTRPAPDAVRQIDGRMERIAELFAMGHWSKARYLEERARLEALRVELEQELTAPTRSPIPLGSLTEAWRVAGPRARGGLLRVFFDELDVLDREVISVVPRADHAAEVMALLERAYGQYCAGDPGGVRTRDLSLERAAS